MAEIKPVVDLDFDLIKRNIQRFLQNQDEFSDYNFEGSGLNVLLNILAYNTHYNAIYTNSLVNESFLDSAIQRSSIISIAKQLGYIPRSVRSAKATVNVFLPTTSQITPSMIFKTTINNQSKLFFSEKTIIGVERDDGYYFDNVVLTEGIFSTIVSSVNDDNKIQLQESNIDVNTIKVSSNLNGSTTYEKFEGLTGVTGTSNIFFVNELSDENYEISFGDGNFGNTPSDDEEFTIEYIISTGASGNGASQFSLDISDSTITTVEPSSGGADKETLEEIKFNAPRFNTTKNRVVTKEDYKSLISASNSNIKSVAVWGGEDNIPKTFGKVFVSLQPKDGKYISKLEKQNLINNVIEPRQPVSMEVEFVDPEFIYIGFDANILYDNKKTTLTESELNSLVLAEIDRFFEEEVNSLDANFYYSQLSKKLVDLSNSFVSINTIIKISRRILPELNINKRYTINFNNKLQPRTLYSNALKISLNGVIHDVIIEDMPSETVAAPNYSGSGLIEIKSLNGDTLISNAGTINYDTGLVILNEVNIVEIIGNVDEMILFVSPHEKYKDIKSNILISQIEEQASAVIPVASRNLIITKDDLTKNDVSRIKNGITINLEQQVSNT